MIIRKGKILNDEGEWEDYVEESDPDRPPIAYTYMGSTGLEIEEDDEVVDFCMRYRIPKIEGLEKVKHLKVSNTINCPKYNQSQIYLILICFRLK